ncbi:hypothetical protein JOE66_000211 [Subtercola frigoramans]|uniref:Uncharacterized protein n=1 Tax=Subtercola frigoramans TaxID=120298 RepID=A0ABS2L0I9_9MICO|nr:hypothetical protein [Subtercola frigoramans]
MCAATRRGTRSLCLLRRVQWVQHAIADQVGESSETLLEVQTDLFRKPVLGPARTE